MDRFALGLGTLDWAFFMNLVNIVIIDIILAGDNAVIIAMAVRSLPRKQRRTGIVSGAGAAVILRVALTFFVSQLLAIDFVKFVGGALIAWIAAKLLVEGGGQQEEGKEAASLWQAIRLIVIADITMSLDNVLAVAGASQNNLFLLFFGLALSIPFVVFTSNMLSYLMDRYPIIIYLGALILGRVAAEMMLGDPFIETWLNPPTWLRYTLEALFAMGVIVVGMLWLRYKSRDQPGKEASSATTTQVDPAPREK